MKGDGHDTKWKNMNCSNNSGRSSNPKRSVRDKRAGSLSFLTWPFLIAPLIAGEEFLAAAFNPAAAKEQAKAALAGAAQHAANGDSPAHDPSKSGAKDETAEGPAASSEAHAVQLDPTEFLAEPQEDAPKPSTARSEETAAAATGGGGGGGGGGDDDADSRAHDARISIDDSSVNELSADSHVGSGRPPDGSMLETVQSNVFCDSFSPSILGSPRLLGGVGDQRMTWPARLRGGGGGP